MWHQAQARFYSSSSITASYDCTINPCAADFYRLFICLRLLGPSAASDVLQLTNSMAGSGQARVHFITNDSNMRLLNSGDNGADADAYDDFFQVSIHLMQCFI